MATKAHCAFVLETLSASLEDREALSLAQVEDLWQHYIDYKTGKSRSGEAAAADDPAEPSDGDVLVSDTEEDEPTGATLSPTYRPAAVTRLLGTATPSSASSSSVQSAVSTPSRTSEASSATSKSSSRSSLFSPLPATKSASSRTAEYPLFVTYNVIQRDGAKRLRGCIGTFEPHKLEEGLSSYALTSAFDDTRFRPITARELNPSLECGVTLLTNFEPVDSPLNWSIGTHGLRISFTYHGRRHGATYLPDVAREQGWTKEETIISLMRKAGWSGRKEDWRKVDLDVVRYQGRQVKMGFDEWEGWRRWVGEEVEA